MEGPACEGPHLALGSDSGRWNADEGTQHSQYRLSLRLSVGGCRLAGWRDCVSRCDKEGGGQPVTGSKVMC